MKTKKILLVKISILALLISGSAYAQPPISWTHAYNASRYNVLGLDLTTGVKSIAYNPSNNDVYAFGHNYYALPANPAPVMGREFGIVRFNHLTGDTIETKFAIHHTPADTIPHTDTDGEMVIGPDGSVYVTGSYFFNAARGNDLVVIKYNSDLDEQWRYYIFGTGSSLDAGIAIALDAAGNVCVAGQITDNGTGTGTDFVAAKINSSGGLVWQKIYTSTGSESDTPTDVIADLSGNVYVTGYCSSAATGNRFFTTRHNSGAGTRTWTKYYNLVPGSALDDKSNSVAVDNVSGNVYVCGTSVTAAGHSNIVTVCYNSAGVQQWGKKINNPGDSNDHGYKVLVDASQKVFVGGDVDRDASGTTTGDLIIRKYNSAGAVAMTIVFNGVSYNCSFGDFAVAASGNIYLAGSCFGAAVPPQSGSSLMTAKFNSSGAFQWSDFISPPQFASCGEGYYGWKLAVNSPTSEIAVGGRHFVDCPGTNTEEWEVRRYNPTAREAGDFSDITLENNVQVNLFPIPSGKVLHINLASTDEIFNATIFNLQGAVVRSLILKSAENNLDISALSNGLYFISIVSEKPIDGDQKSFHGKFIKN